MQVETSIPNLIKIAVEAPGAQHAPRTLEASGIEFPSLTWVILQFCAKNPLCLRALNYTCALKLAHDVQQRTLRATSTDSHYVAVAYKYMRSYGLWLHEQLHKANSGMSVIPASFDDKCKVRSFFFDLYFSGLCFFI
jgi:hypothetical protein